MSNHKTVNNNGAGHLHRLVRWLYWRLFEEYGGGTPNRSDYPEVGELFTHHGWLYQLTRVESDERPYHVIHAITLGRMPSNGGGEVPGRARGGKTL